MLTNMLADAVPVGKLLSQNQIRFGWQPQKRLRLAVMACVVLHQPDQAMCQ
jgi:hypothetical protein